VHVQAVRVKGGKAMMLTEARPNLREAIRPKGLTAMQALATEVSAWGSRLTYLQFVLGYAAPHLQIDQLAS